MTSFQPFCTLCLKDVKIEITKQIENFGYERQSPYNLHFVIPKSKLCPLLEGQEVPNTYFNK